MDKPILSTYDHSEFKKLREYYKNRFTEDYQSLSGRAAKINLHSNFISISKSLEETESLYRKKGKQELNNLIGSIACCLWKDDDYLNEVAGIFDEFSYDTHMAPGVEADTERKEIFNKILEAAARVFISFCNIHGFHEDLKALKDIIKNHKELFISSYEYYFPEIEDDYSFFFHLEKLYKENFKVVARLYPTWGLVDIINLNGYDYQIKEQDFKERDSIRNKIKIHPNSMNDLFAEMKDEGEEYTATRKEVRRQACIVIEKSEKPLSYFKTKNEKYPANSYLYNPVLEHFEKIGNPIPKSTVRKYLDSGIKDGIIPKMIKERTEKQ